jgi:hypothetical protein
VGLPSVLRTQATRRMTGLAPGTMPFPNVMAPGAGDSVRRFARGDGGSGDQAKPIGAAAPTGEAARETAVPPRGENVVGAADQLKPLDRTVAMGLGVRMAAWDKTWPPPWGTAVCMCDGDGDRLT